jgi:GAF domain-containing protein
VSREQEVLAAFIEFADTFVDEYDIVDFLHRLAARCVDILDASEAGIMLADRDGTLRYAASSSERMRSIELFELQHAQGPCLDAFRGGVAVHRPLDDEAATRWPILVPEAREVGFNSVSALPMRLRDNVIGSLNLFSANPIPLNPEDQRVAQALADVATIGILQERALSDAHVVTTQLAAALESRVMIEQAKGIVAERNGISPDTAFTMLRTYARTHNQLLSRTARAVVEGTLPVESLG